MKLKPCPFCGGEAEIKNISDVNLFYVGCKSCGALSKPYFDEGNPAIEAWNRREPIDRIVEQLEEKIEENPYCSLANYRAGLFEAIEIVKGGAE